MGKHDKTIEISTEEFYENRIKDLEARLKFSEETVKKLQEQCSRMSRWASEIEANADDKLTELEAENAKLRGKIVRLVESYV